MVLLVEIGRVTVSCKAVPAKAAPPAQQVQDVDEDDDPLTPMEQEGIKKCESDEALMELCARCTKQVKTRDVYPMCCLNEDLVGDWCRDFVYFGIQ